MLRIFLLLQTILQRNTLSTKILFQRFPIIDARSSLEFRNLEDVEEIDHWYIIEQTTRLATTIRLQLFNHSLILLASGLQRTPNEGSEHSLPHLHIIITQLRVIPQYNAIIIYSYKH